MKRRNLLLGLAALASGCGGGGSTSEPAPVQDAPSKSRPHIVLDGDSLATASFSTWPSALESQLGAYTFHHLAATGSRAAVELAARWDSTVPPVSPSTLNYTVGYYVLVIGANDARMGGATVEQSWGAILAAWRKARAAGFKVIAATVHSAVTPFIQQEEADAFKDDLNARIRASSAEYDALLSLDLLFPNTSDTSLLYDGLHFTPAGNRLVQSRVAALISGRRLTKGGTYALNEYETALVVLNDEPLAITFTRPWEAESTYTGIRVRRFLTGEILADKPWPGALGCAIVVDGVIHIFGASNPGGSSGVGNKVIRSTLAADFTPSPPTDALLMNAPSSPYKFYNTSVTEDPNGFRMAVETSVGVYFARSTDLNTWSFQGGQMLPGQYIGCPSIHYINGAHHLTYLAAAGGGVYETRTAKSTDDCLTFTYGKTLLAPDSTDGKNCSDVDMIEHGGRVLGVYLDGDQITYANLRTWVYEGTMAEMFAAYD